MLKIFFYENISEGKLLIKRLKITLCLMFQPKQYLFLKFLVLILIKRKTLILNVYKTIIYIYLFRELDLAIIYNYNFYIIISF